MQLLMFAQCSSCRWLYLHMSTWLNTGCSWKELLRYIQIYSMGIYVCVLLAMINIMHVCIIQQTSNSYQSQFHSFGHSFDDNAMLSWYIYRKFTPMCLFSAKGTIFVMIFKGATNDIHADHCMAYIPTFCHTRKLIEQST